MPERHLYLVRKVRFEVSGIVPALLVELDDAHRHWIQFAVPSARRTHHPAEVAGVIQPPAMGSGFRLERRLKPADQFLSLPVVMITTEDPGLLEKPPRLEPVAAIDNKSGLDGKLGQQSSSHFLGRRQVGALVRRPSDVDICPETRDRDDVPALAAPVLAEISWLEPEAEVHVSGLRQVLYDPRGTLQVCCWQPPGDPVLSCPDGEIAGSGLSVKRAEKLQRLPLLVLILSYH